MTEFQISWDRGVANIQSLGGMLGPIELLLDDGRSVQPMSVAPWSNDCGPAYEELPQLLKRLRGEWPCVPYGAPKSPDGLPEAWNGSLAGPLGDDFHGYSANNNWDCVAHESDEISLHIDYPDDHAIRYLRREIKGVPGKAEVSCCLEINARQDIALPIALHSVFRMPDQSGAMWIDPGPFDIGMTFPKQFETGVSIVEPGQTFTQLSAAPTETGVISLDRLPLAENTEELVQLLGVSGQVSLANTVENCLVTLEFDPSIFPSLVLWISNRGRANYPWNRRFLALGVEPVCGAFDLGPEVGCNPENPIAKAGYSTAVQLVKGTPLRTRYRVGAQLLSRSS